jgi:hypothetical protein
MKRSTLICSLLSFLIIHTSAQSIAPSKSPAPAIARRRLRPAHPLSRMVRRLRKRNHARRLEPPGYTYPPLLYGLAYPPWRPLSYGTHDRYRSDTRQPASHPGAQRQCWRSDSRADPVAINIHCKLPWRSFLFSAIQGT